MTREPLARTGKNNPVFFNDIQYTLDGTVKRTDRKSNRRLFIRSLFLPTNWVARTGANRFFPLFRIRLPPWPSFLSQPASSLLARRSGSLVFPVKFIMTSPHPSPQRPAAILLRSGSRDVRFFQVDRVTSVRPVGLTRTAGTYCNYPSKRIYHISLFRFAQKSTVSYAVFLRQ